MAKVYGQEYPERPLMSTLSELLGIPHFSTSNGGTVRSDFLKAVLVALDGDPTGKDKDSLIEACVVAATRRPFASSLLSPGGTVTNAALQTMIDGIARHGVPGRLDPTPAPEPEPEREEFDPALITDERDRRLAEQAVREGQDAFRAAVLDAYRNRCAITETNAVRALEAAHVTPYLGPATNCPPNGICLRSDLHRLWDGGQLAVHESTLRVVLSPALKATTYADLDGLLVPNLPRTVADRPATAALRHHREWCQL